MVWGTHTAFSGELMGYDWIFEVLEDLKSFAKANGLPALAAKADEALQIAAIEVATLPDTPVQIPPRRSSSTH